VFFKKKLLTRNKRILLTIVDIVLPLSKVKGLPDSVKTMDIILLRDFFLKNEP